jgi:BASS family bile acid:Na+ symporter
LPPTHRHARSAASSLLAPVITPFVASSAVAWLLTSHVAIRLPVGQTMRQLLIGLVFPIVLGMLIRHFAPSWTARRQLLLTRLSLVAVAALIIYVLADQIATIAQGLRQLVLAAALFSGIAVGSGYVGGWPWAASSRTARASPSGSIREISARPS